MTLCQTSRCFIDPLENYQRYNQTNDSQSLLFHYIIIFLDIQRFLFYLSFPSSVQSQFRDMSSTNFSRFVYYNALHFTHWRFNLLASIQPTFLQFPARCNIMSFKVYMFTFEFQHVSRYIDY